MHAISGLLAVALCLACLVGPAEAHHAFSANFDVDKLIEVEGRVTALRWQNPHVLLTLETPTGTTWQVESQAKNILERTEITAQMLAVGTTVSLAGFPARAGNGVFALNALLADGRELILRAGRPAYFDGRRAGRPENVLEGAVVDPAAATAGLFRVWSMQFAGESRWRWPESYPLTPAAATARARFDPVAGVEALGDCAPKPMPWVMEQPFPLEIARQGDDLVIRLEERDTVRVVHMQANAPSAVQPSPLGYSFGRSDGNDLVVRTVAIDAPYLNATGVPLSPAVTLDERFTVSADGSRLDYTLTVTDPGSFTAPFTVRNFWIWRPGQTLEPYACVPETGIR